MTDLYNYVNPKNGKHSPLISKETYDIIMANADVSGKKTVISRLCSHCAGQKSFGILLPYSYFFYHFLVPSWNSASFSKFSCSSHSPHPIQSWNWEKILDTCVQHCMWGEGRGWTCVNWKTSQKHKSVPRLLSMIVGSILPQHKNCIGCDVCLHI